MGHFLLHCWAITWCKDLLFFLKNFKKCIFHKEYLALQQMRYWADSVSWVAWESRSKNIHLYERLTSANSLPHSSPPYPKMYHLPVSPKLYWQSHTGGFSLPNPTPHSIIKECPVIFITEVADIALNCRFLVSCGWFSCMRNTQLLGGCQCSHQSLQAASTSGYVRVVDKLEDQWLVPPAAPAAIEKLIWGSL